MQIEEDVLTNEIFEGEFFCAMNEYFGKVSNVKPLAQNLLEKSNAIGNNLLNLKGIINIKIFNRASKVRYITNTPFKINPKLKKINSIKSSYISKKISRRLFMSTYTFYKMHGIGNDYIYFDCINYKPIINPNEASKILSQRHYSVGADGIILIEKSKIVDVKMRMFNADGSEGSMCGNGIRCVAKYCYEKGIVKKDVFFIETLAGIKKVKLTIVNNNVELVEVNMGKAILNPIKIPVLINTEKVINYPILIDDKEYRINCVSMGNPHCVVFENDIKNLDINNIGQKFENNRLFPNKINTEFVKVINNKTLSMRVYERGSKETLACGTGACASVVAACLNGYCKIGEEILVRLLGGNLLIKFLDNAQVFMKGSATMVYKGEIEL